MKKEILYPKVVVYRDAFPNPEILVDRLKRYQDWEKWYDVGKQIVIGRGLSGNFDNFPSPAEWEAVQNKFVEPISELADVQKTIESVFYDLTKDYLKEFPFEVDNWQRFASNILCYETRDKDFVTREASGTEALALPFHTDLHQPTKDELGVKPFLTVTIYLNDDHEGGEIAYRIFDGSFEDCQVVGDQLIPIIEYNKPIDQFTYKPKAGDVIIFPSDIPYYHGVYKVTKGSKYFIRTFWMYNKQ
jgi:hypothetical protein